MSTMRFDTIRNEEQMRRMKKCEEEGVCYLCTRLNTHADIIYSGNYWFIMKNDFPYEGSRYHYLIISKRHVTRMTELSDEEWSEKIKMIQWLEKHLQTPGFSEFSRNGNMMYTHASLDHLHFHFLVGSEKREDSEKIKVTLGYKENSG